MVPPYLERIPVIAPLARREMDEYERDHGEPIDFTKAWWHPPIGPEDLLASETSQITRALGLTPIVSITDHDNIDAPLTLQLTRPLRTVPLSFEWTVPCGRGFLHLGVHNLPHDTGVETFRTLARYTECPDAARLTDLLERLGSHPETLLVLNHPVWDLAGVGLSAHLSLVRQFLVDHGERIHALELNGYRSWRENTEVITLADAFDFPLISGGDRHGRAPNSLLNLTTTASFGDFAREIREQRRSAILVMPEYRKSLVSRKLAVASDAMRTYPTYPDGQQHWSDRISYEQDGITLPLSATWPGGGPWWVRLAVRIFATATRMPLQPALRLLVRLAGASMSDRPLHPTLIDTLAPLPSQRATGDKVIG